MRVEPEILSGKQRRWRDEDGRRNGNQILSAIARKARLPRRDANDFGAYFVTITAFIYKSQRNHLPAVSQEFPQERPDRQPTHAAPSDSFEQRNEREAAAASRKRSLLRGISWPRNLIIMGIKWRRGWKGDGRQAWKTRSASGQTRGEAREQTQ